MTVSRSDTFTSPSPVTSRPPADSLDHIGAIKLGRPSTWSAVPLPGAHHGVAEDRRGLDAAGDGVRRGHIATETAGYERRRAVGAVADAPPAPTAVCTNSHDSNTASPNQRSQHASPSLKNARRLRSRRCREDALDEHGAASRFAKLAECRRVARERAAEKGRMVGLAVSQQA